MCTAKYRCPFGDNADHYRTLKEARERNLTFIQESNGSNTFPDFTVKTREDGSFMDIPAPTRGNK